jgi:hypothetical protein
MDPGRHRTRCFAIAAAILGATSSGASVARAQCSPGSLVTPAGAYSAGSLPRFVAAGDLNGDAVPDLAVANSAVDANTISILLGNGNAGAGDGTFRPGGTFDAGGQALGLVCGDFNGDGIRDLIVANGDWGTISVLLGQGGGGVGDGTFSSPAGYPAGASPGTIATGDFNGDGIQDLAVASRGTRTIDVLIGQGTGGVGDGTFVPGFSTFVGHAPIGIASGDVSGDGIADIVFVTISQPKVGVMYGGGFSGIWNGSFSQPVYYSAGPSPADFTMKDLNGDGLPDVAVANKSGGGVYALFALAGGTFDGPYKLGQGLSLSSIFPANVDHDGHEDLLATTSPGNQLVFFRGAGGPSFFAPTIEGAVGPSPSDLLVVDLNGDCAGDVVVVSANNIASPPSNLTVLTGRCVPSTCQRAPTSVAVADRPGDEGGAVRLFWHASVLDDPNGSTIRSYQVWRQVPGTPPGDWTLVAEIAADGALQYSADAPTTRDSTAGESAPHTFFVRAATNHPGLSYDSESMTGHSVDNLAPPAPRFVVAEFGKGGIHLHWTPSTAADLLEYRVYRGASLYFTPGSGNQIAVVRDTQCVDPGGTPSSFYRVASVDIHGNVGPTFEGPAIACSPPSCSFNAMDGSGFALSHLLSATRFDTTFRSFRAAYDLTQGWVYGEASGGSGTGIITTANDTYWITGIPVGPPLHFNASLKVVIHTSQTCGFHCAQGFGQASITELGVVASACPGVSDPCVPLSHPAYEPFRLSISARAGISGSVYAATADVTATLQFSGLPPGAAVTSCSGYLWDFPVPVQLSLVRADVGEGMARITWYSPGGDVSRAIVYRGTVAGEWSRQDQIFADGSGFLTFVDKSVEAGRRYGYRLGVDDAGRERLLGETWVDVPFVTRFVLEGVTPNPATGPAEVAFSLPTAHPAALEVFDLTGRIIHSREVGTLGAGRHALMLDEAKDLRPGVYLLRLSQDNARVSKRFVKIR